MSGGIFAKVRMYLIPLGELSGKVRREILEKRVIENQGSVVREVNEADVLLAGKNLDEKKLEKSRIKDKPLVDIDWVTQSLSKNEQLDYNQFLIGSGESGAGLSPGKRKEREEDESALERPTKSAEEVYSANEELAKLFDRLESLVSSSPNKRDSFRAMAYRTAASAVRKFPRPIRSEEDADELRSEVGEKSVEKIEEFLTSGKIQKFQYLDSDFQGKARMELMGIWGVGPAVANDLVLRGYDSVDKVRAAEKEGVELLNANQKMGLQYYEELQAKMPRSEVGEIRDVVREAVKELFGDGLEMTVCGSYRRGAEFCSDADFVFAWKRDVAHPLSPQATMEKLVTHLTNTGFLIDHFNRNNHHTIFLGICRLGPSRSARRIDMKVWPRESAATAIVHFTGNADFNRRLRLLAKKKGYKLNDLGLTKSDGTVIQMEREEEVFQHLGIAYIPPEKRTSSSVLEEAGSESS